MSGNLPGFVPDRYPGSKPGALTNVVRQVVQTVSASSTGITQIGDRGLEADNGFINIGNDGVTLDVTPDGDTVVMNLKLNDYELFSTDKEYTTSGEYANTPDQNYLQQASDHTLSVNIKDAGGPSAEVEVTVIPKIQ